MKKILLMSCMIVMQQMFALAEGYQVNLQGQKQTGMGHIGTGLNLGASSMHFNPGALSMMEKKYEFSVGISPIFSDNTFQKVEPSVYQAESDNPTGTPFYFYGAAKLNEKLALGLGVTTPYGNSLVWGDNWDGRYLIQDIALQAIFIQPTVSYRLMDQLSVGAGFVVASGKVDLNKGLPFVDQQGNEGQANLTGSTIAYGFNAGVYYQPSEKWSFGVDYRSEIMMKMDEGDATFKVPVSMSGYFPKGTTFSAELPMPANLSVGIGWQATEKLLIGVDYQYVFWSAYQSLDFDFSNNDENPVLRDSKNARNFTNSAVYRIGGEYKINSSFDARAGFYFDQTPIPEHYLSPETPGTDKLGFSAGASWYINDKLSLDVSFLYIHGNTRQDGYADTNFYGTYYTHAVIPGFGLNYAF
jgi:long-chain fatty acid transport protein